MGKEFASMNMQYPALECFGGRVEVDQELIFRKRRPLHNRLNELCVVPVRFRDGYPAVFTSDVNLKVSTNPLVEPAEDFDDEERYFNDLGLRELTLDEVKTLMVLPYPVAIMVNGLPCEAVFDRYGECAVWHGAQWVLASLHTA